MATIKIEWALRASQKRVTGRMKAIRRRMWKRQKLVMEKLLKQYIDCIDQKRKKYVIRTSLIISLLHFVEHNFIEDPEEQSF